MRHSVLRVQVICFPALVEPNVNLLRNVVLLLVSVAAHVQINVCMFDVVIFLLLDVCETRLIVLA